MSQGFINALTLTLPVGVTSGGTGLTSTTINQLLYSSGTSTIAGLATANNGVLVTSAGGVPSISSTLPSGIAATNMALTTPTLGAASATSLSFSSTSGVASLTCKLEIEKHFRFKLNLIRNAHKAIWVARDLMLSYLA